MRRRGKSGGTLEYFEMPGGLGYLGDRLDAGGAGADHGDPLALETDRTVRPARSLVELALEVAVAGEIRLLGRRQRPGREDDIAADIGLSAIGGQRPQIGTVIVGHPRDSGVEDHTAAQIETIGN